MKQSLEELREEIESLDGALLRLWERRMYAAMKAGVLKRDAGLEIIDPTREKQLWATWQQQLDEDNADLAALLFVANTSTAKLRQGRICGQHQGNLYLIGMPAGGKSTVGRELARITGRGFCDMDRVLVEMYGRTIAQMFEQGGEALFRSRETALLSALAAQPGGTVVATGGGIVTSPLNISLMRASGAIILLERERVEEADLADRSRPLCPDKAHWQQLWQERASLYRGAAQVTVINRGEEQTAAQLAAMLE